MTRFHLKLSAVLAFVLGLGATSSAQIVSPYEPACYPDNGDPWSDDFNLFHLRNDLFGVSLGISGTFAYSAACFPTNGFTADVRGRIGFTIGNIGSVQDNDQGTIVDDQLTLNYGMPFAIGGSWGYAMFLDDAGAKHFWAENAFHTFYEGASNRYMYVETTSNNVNIGLQIDLIGDAARLAWTLQGTDATTRQWTLWFGQWVTMASGLTGYSQGATFVSMPNRRPVTTDSRFVRQDNPSLFPDYVDFAMNQEWAYGLQILNEPNAATTDPTSGNSDQSIVASIDIGTAYNLVGVPITLATNTTSMPDILIPDTQFVFNTANPNPRSRDSLTGYIQKFQQQSIPAANVPRETIRPQWVSYYKSTTGVSNYALPYSAVVDTPKLVQVQPNNPNQFDYPPQGYYKFRVYIDNVGGFGQIDREIPLEGVKVTLNLPAGMFAYNTAETDPYNPVNPQRQMTRFVDRIEARDVGHVDFPVAVSQNAFGTLSYQVKIEPAAAIKSKTINGTITVASQPRVNIRGESGNASGANLISLPWVFQNSDWGTILSSPGQPMVLDQNFRAFKWDSLNQQYLPQTGPEREIGTWIISKPDLGVIQLRGGPSQPTDLYRGAPLVTLHRGWNLIGNPYNYQFPIAQINGVSGAIGDRVNAFQELVDQGIVNGALAWWDQENQTYRYIGVTDNLIPNRGYWIYVASSQDLLLSMPPVFQPFLKYVASGQAANAKSIWVQNDKQWRLQVSARTNKALDDQNFVGHVPTAKDVKRLRVADPPAAPAPGTVTVAFNDTVDGKPMKLASAFTEKTGRQEWTFDVAAKDAGAVTVTWPNLSTVPKNLKVRLVDTATGTSRDLRRSSGYTFTNEKADTTRTFKIQVEPGIVSSTKIGNVVVTRDTRSPGSPVSVQYTLTGSATTTVRILGADGREIYVPTRGRADLAGANSVVWNLRDSANRSVAPGNYRVEIVAETQDGQRVRRTVPVVVTR